VLEMGLQAGMPGTGFVITRQLILPVLKLLFHLSVKATAYQLQAN
jgi:hypothetical protein